LSFSFVYWHRIVLLLEGSKEKICLPTTVALLLNTAGSAICSLRLGWGHTRNTSMRKKIIKEEELLESVILEFKKREVPLIT